MSFRWALAGLTLGLGWITPAPAASSTLDAWRKSAAAFESFLAARENAGWMREVEVTDRGAVLTSANGRNLTAVLWWQGVAWAGVTIQGGANDPLQMWRRAMPGVQAIAVQAVTPLGYQYVTPLRWFAVSSGPEDQSALFGGERRSIQPAPAPTPAEEFWPNDRLLAWVDWQISPKRHRSVVYEKNTRTQLAVSLQVDFHGRVHRGLVPDPDAEAALRWRVFGNGRLVEQGRATGGRELDTARHGPGNYLALVGIETPAGFFPVSNQLIYSLAPQLAKGLQVAFGQFDYGRPTEYPAWYRRVIPPPQGDGPVLWSDPEELARARSIVAAWRGAAWLENRPDQPWILKTPDLQDLRLRKAGEGLADPSGPSLPDEDADDDHDGLTNHEERERGVAPWQMDTDGDGGH